MTQNDKIEGSDLTGKLLIAMPGMGDPRFLRGVIFMCAHSEEGAMGLVVNHPVPDLTMGPFLEQLDLPCPDVNAGQSVYWGGPVEQERGFVLHSAGYAAGGGTLEVNDSFSMTATRDVLEDIGNGNGPDQSLIALGYAGWGPGQLDEEILSNAWLTATPEPGLVFSGRADDMWSEALALLGISPQMLSGEAGHA